MAERTREHELETLSKRDFANRIPVGWVDRAIDADDYGIDRQVEIFENGRPTGLEFYVQLKATDQELPRALAVSLAVKHREHYGALAAPVLLCRFHAPSGRMFVKWFHTYDPHYAARAQGDAKTFTFRWAETDEWVDETPDRLKREVAAFRRFRSRRLDFPIAFHVEASDGTVSAAEALVVLADAARQVNRVVAIDPGPAEPGDAALVFESERILATFGGVSSVSLHRPITGADVTPDLAADALMTVGLALLQVGHPDAAAQIISAVGAAAPSILIMDVTSGAYSAFILSSRTLDALRLARAVGASGSDDAEVAEMILAMSAVGPGVPEEAREEYRSVMRARAERRIPRGASELVV